VGESISPPRTIYRRFGYSSIVVAGMAGIGAELPMRLGAAGAKTASIRDELLHQSLVSGKLV
jgi:hypothetical protein